MLTISEFKAVLAHEFGHFAQKSMAVGRWVYTAQQVATQLIYHRDGLDTFLNVISGIDLRIAWIGWVLRLVVWSLRSILDSLLSLVMLAERALSREMEFQADLVAVSTTGSDALIHGLFRLPAADQAWQESIDFINEQLDEGYKTEDVFEIQARILDKQRVILNDPEFGAVPEMPAEGREQHRIFTADIAQPPQMWATHPQSHLREANAKETYVPGILDDRSAWLIFDNPEELRKSLSKFLFEDLKQKDRPIAATLQALEKSYHKEYYNPDYRGGYLERSVVCDAETVEDLYLPAGITASVDELYPAELTDELEKMRNLSKEKALLVELRDRTFETTDGIIRFRGDVIKRSGLGHAIAESTEDLEKCKEKLRDHDRRCRSFHLAIAESIHPSWAAYLKGLLTALHYADHNLRDLSDANRKLVNTYHIILADGNVSGRERDRIVQDAHEVFKCLRSIYEAQKSVHLDEGLKAKLKIESWKDSLEEFKLQPPSVHNIGDWLDAVGGWVGAACGALFSLREAALEELLATEAHLMAVHQDGAHLPATAPSPSVLPSSYNTLIAGDERELQTKLNLWDSFQTASGFFPGLMRFLISFVIGGLAVYVTLPKEWADVLLTFFQNLV